jgi:hypothetical protein
LTGAGFGLFNAEFLQQLCNLPVDVFGAVVAVEAPNDEGKGRQELSQRGDQEALADALDGEDALELGHFIHGGDQV